MAKRKNKKSKHEPQERDSAYILKIVLYMIIGAQWLRFTDPELTRQIPLPVGLVIGGFFAVHEHFQIDRKIEFAILIIASFIGFWSQTGLLLVIL